MFRIDSEVIKKTRAILKEEKVFTLDRLVLIMDFHSDKYPPCCPTKFMHLFCKDNVKTIR